MTFHELREIFLSNLRARVRNGEITERRLARLIGVSQPHIHNILKGKRVLTPEVGDLLLTELKMSVLDLLDPYWQTPRKAPTHPDFPLYCSIRVLDGRLGPGHLWPTKVGNMERFRVSLSELAKMTSPVVVRLGADPAMVPLFAADECALLDQSVSARSAIDPEALYAIKWSRYGLLRKLRLDKMSVWLVSQEDEHQPDRWIDVSLGGADLMQIVRARAVLLRPEVEWPLS